MNIIIYTKTGCPWCKGVLDLFVEKKVKYEEREVHANPAYMSELVAKSGQSKTPTLDIDGDIITDTDKNAVAAYLKAKGVGGF